MRQAQPTPSRVRGPAATAAGALAARPERRKLGPLGLLAAHPRVGVGLAVIGLVTTLAILAPALGLQRPEVQVTRLRLAPPGSAYLLGGDGLGRDVLSRLIYAGRVSLAVGLLSMLIAIVVGVSVGSIAGYFGGWTDRVLMRLTDLVLVFPTFFLLILVVATFGRGLALLILMIGLTSWPANARVVRASVLKLRGEDFVTAARVAGAGTLRIVLRHLVPQLVPIIISSATIRVASNILIESGLSYLGLGVQPPTPSWGNMLFEGRRFFEVAWWISTWPGVAIFVTVLSLNLVGDLLRDLLDPRMRPVTT